MATPRSVYAAFREAVARWPRHPFLETLPETAAIYGIEAGEITYAEAAAKVDRLIAAYRVARYGVGHRVALLLENRPIFFFHWFALNALGASVVPVNPDLRAAELEYLIGHAEPVLAVAIASRQDDLRRAAPALRVVGPNDPPPPPSFPGGTPNEDPSCEAALLYTSGSTGLPKGCVVSQEWFLRCGEWYLGMGGLYTLHQGIERMLTPLPLFHMNAMANSTMAMVMTGGCLIQLDRFHPTTWWDSVVRSRATIVHCLGVMPAMLMSLSPSPLERAHRVRFAFCPGPDPRLHAAAEERFGVKFIDGWAMTETGTGAVITAHVEPRIVGRSCFGRVPDFMEARIVRDDGADCGADEPGELFVRHAGPNPRYGFFTEYLKDPAATAAAWEGGWFHTGDIVRRDTGGWMYFVDRKKNIIRRSGENIAAVEVESVLQQHPLVRTVAVAAVPDAVRGDEVLAAVVPREPIADTGRAAHDLVGWCLSRLAYYTAPGYVAFIEALPLTATSKIARGTMKDLAKKLLDDPGCIDTRALKKRAA
jgi:acyl-CoA synthetase (AMP-forming)/AMP-acid ligase II